MTNTPMQALNLQNDVTFVEAARCLAQRIMAEGGEGPGKRIAYGWRLVLGRPPAEDELAVLHRAYDRYLSTYQKDPNDALRLLSNGESTRDETLPADEHAAFTMVAKTILNLDETITRE